MPRKAPKDEKKMQQEEQGKQAPRYAMFSASGVVIQPLWKKSSKGLFP